jgi:hypothetical protein
LKVACRHIALSASEQIINNSTSMRIVFRISDYHFAFANDRQIRQPF